MGWKRIYRSNRNTEYQGGLGLAVLERPHLEALDTRHFRNELTQEEIERMAAATLSEGLKATSARKDLFEGIQIVGKAVATRSSLPILTHIRIAVHDGRVSLMATDLEMW